MRTNKNRVWTIGPQPKDSDVLRWEILDKPRKSPTSIFIEESRRGIGEVVFESDKPSGVGLSPPVTTPASIYPPTRLTERFFYTSASLANISHIAACHHELEGQPSIVGLLLQYHDGRKRGVGHVQLDQLGSSVEVGYAEGLAFRISDDTRKVIDFDLFRTEKEGWICMTWRGSLGWWFSEMGCKLYHEGCD